MPYAAISFWARIRLLARQPTWWAEVSIALSLTLWAAICISGAGSLNHPSFHLLTRLAPESAWEKLSLAAGLFHIVALIINGKSPWLDGYHWRVAASLFSGWFLSFLLLNFISADPIPPGAAFYIVPWAMDLFVTVRNYRRNA